MERTGQVRATLYGGLAESLVTLIGSGTFQEGEKIPSIRIMSRQFGVSVNTVREAYGILETKGLIVGRPQSGFFVRRRPVLVSTANLAQIDLLDPHEVLPCAIREESPSLTAGKPFSGLDLARAAPDMAYLPTHRLNSFLGAVSREAGWATMDYDTQKGLPQLREAVAKSSLEAGIRLGPDDFLITGGCLPALVMAVEVLCQAGDTVAVESPTYSEFLKLFKQLGLRVLEIPTSPQEGMNLDVLEWALDKHEVKLVLTIPNFNNPGTFVMPEHRKKALVDLIVKKSIPLLEDDAYGDLSFLDKRPVACKSFDTHGMVIYCSSISKTVSPGYRVGWIAGGRWHEALTQHKAMSSSAASMPAQMAVARYLEHGNYSRHLRSLRRRIADHTTTIAELVLETFPEGTTLSLPTGGLFLWICLPEAVDTDELYARTVPEGIFFRPGSVFSANGRFRNHLRLGTGTWNSALEKAITRLGELASAP